MDLNHQNPPKGLAGQAAVLADPDKRMKTEVRLQGHALWLVRALWLLIVACELFYLVNNLAAAFVLYHTACADSAKMSCAKVLQLSVTRLPALAQYGWSLDGYALYALVCDLIQIVFYLGLGALIFWRSSDRRISLFASLWLITFAVVGIEYVPLPGLLGFLGGTLQLLAWFGLALLFAIFPDGRFVPRWAWILPTLFVSLVGYTLTPLSPPDSATSIWFGAAGYGIFAITVGMQVYRYRAAASPMERQQIKWFASGFAAFVLGVVAQNLLPLVIPALSQPDSWYPLANPAAWTFIFVLIPVGIGIALLRYRLWDIDVILNRTLVYGLLTLLLALIYVGLIFGGQALLGWLLQSNDAPVIVVSTLIVAVLFRPLRQRIQDVIDRRFYRTKYDAVRVLQSFSAALHQEVDLDQLREQLLTVVQETMQPTSLSLWISPVKQQKASGGTSGESLSRAGERPGEDRSDSQ